jgi:hypothetical protein
MHVVDDQHSICLDKQTKFPLDKQTKFPGSYVRISCPQSTMCRNLRAMLIQNTSIVGVQGVIALVSQLPVPYPVSCVLFPHL